MGRKRKTQISTQDDDNEGEGSSKRSRLTDNKLIPQENSSSTQNSTESFIQLAQTSRSAVPIRYKDVEAKLKANLRSGKIKKIYLQNFMCHANFEVNLNKCINIIVGLNGSGKSAILTAIAIGLGGKASSTARSTNLKELVRRGEPSATIEITLANDGIDTYEHDVFGDEIIVSRTINATSGASVYKLKTQNGRVVSTGRQDLIKMSMCLNIQVENPVLILNQDAARSFLKECDPKKLYQFFMKATQIEAIIEKLNSCYQTYVASEGQLKAINEFVKKLEGDIEEVRAKLTRLDSVRKLRYKIESLQNEVEWVKVIQVENELKLATLKLTAKRDEVSKISDLMNNKGKYEKENREKIRELGTVFQQLSLDADNSDVKYDNSKKDFEGERDKLSEFENSHKSFEDRLAKIIPNISQLEQDIAEHENNPMNAENLRQENQARIDQVEKKRKEQTALLENAKRDFQMFQQALNVEKENSDEIQRRMRLETDKMGGIDGQIAQYKNAGKDTLSVYGASARRLLKELEVMHSQKKFTQLPKAFLGRFIEVHNKKYRQAVETVLRNLMTAFIVNCDKDRLVLANILKKYSDIPNPQIITTDFINQVYDVSNGMVCVQRGQGTVFINVIKVSDPVVMNCLIDQCRIERIVIVETTDQAIQLTHDERCVPKNLSRVVQLNPLSEFYPAPNYRTYSIREQPLKYIQTNFVDLIRELETQRRNAEKKLAEIRNQYQEIHVKIRDYNKQVGDKKKQMSELQRKFKQLSQELEELNSIEFPENTDIEYLRQQLVEEKQRKVKIEAKINETNEKLEQRRLIVERFKKVMDQQMETSRESRQKMRKVQLQIEAFQKNLDNMKIEMETKGREIKNLQNEEAEIDRNVKELERKLRDMTIMIRSARVTSHRTVDDLTKSIKLTEKRILAIESSNENIQDVETLLTNKQEQLETTIKTSLALDTVLKKLTKLRETRYIYVRKLRQHMSMRIKHKFYQLMQLRNYSADIEIDHRDQKLELKIIPRDGEIEGAVNNTKSLSGGERSYSTVAFLLSLWSCVDHPFYFLDEYDVFSDEYNRHMMTMLLLNEAEKKKDKQFGFLTPQEFSNVQASDFIKIHKLQDPDRLN